MKKIVLITIALLAASTVLFASGQRAGGGSAGGGSAGGQGAPARAGTVPDYINPDGYFPIVKPGTNVSLTVSWLPDDTFAKHSDPSQLWYFRYVKEAFNIDLKVTPRAAGPEIKNLMFASGDLPDIWMAGITPDDIVNYGVGEKLILPISDYITPELMPNLYKVYNDDPSLKGPSTAPDGKIYGFSNIKERNWLHGPITGGLASAFYNKKWLEQLNTPVPETLEQYVDLLRKFKTLGSDILPDAGIFRTQGAGQNNLSLLYSALGFHWTGAHNITGVGTRNGKATFIYGDREIYPKFLETLNTMYKEGLISRDFFTMDNNSRNAITMAGKAGVIPGPPITFVNQQFHFDYAAVKPLTSEFNNQIFWVAPNNYVTPNVIVVMSHCKYPEVACRLLDYNYEMENMLYVQFGYPDTKPEYQYGMLKGWTIGINDNFPITNIDDPVLYEAENYYIMSRIRPINNIAGLVGNSAAICKRLYGLNPLPEVFDPTKVDSYGRGSIYENLSVHAVTEFPFVVYWDAQTARRLTDLGTVINDYVQVQFAQFVTGARPLSELNAYFAELDAMNYQEYLKHFVDYYERVKAGQ